MSVSGNLEINENATSRAVFTGDRSLFKNSIELMVKKDGVPPKCVLTFFRWFCRPEIVEDIEGDLVEKFNRNVTELGFRKARDRLTLQIFKLFRPGIIRPVNIFDHLLNRNPMFRNYIKLGFRNLKKHHSVSLINIMGITVGMTCFLLISLYIQYESSYDTQHSEVDRIYRIYQQQPGNVFRGTDLFALAPLALVPAIREEIPEIEAATTLQVEEALFSRGDELSYEEGLFADEHLFEIFQYPLKEGRIEMTLNDPSAILLTEKMASRYFGNTSPIGQSLRFENDRELIVQGVLADPPKNQHFSFEFITSLKNYPFYKDNLGRWNINNYRAYVKLPKNYDPRVLEEKMMIFDEEVKAAYANSSSNPPHYFLQPLTDIHLHSHLNMELSANSDIRYIYLAATIAIIILLLAYINYMNLAAAQSGQRAKEVGMRKVMGARRKQLIDQFIVEAGLMTLLSFILALGLTFLAWPLINGLLDLEMPFTLLNNRFFLMGLLGIALLIGLVSGLYPAILASRVNPTDAFKGRWFKSHQKVHRAQNGLVVGQFAAAIVLAICSLVIYQQLRYIQQKKLGYSRDQVLYVPYRMQEMLDKSQMLRSELLKHPQVDQVAFSSNLPLNMNEQGMVRRWEGNAGNHELPIYRNWIDDQYIQLMDMELVEGRNFSPELATDSTQGYILNETAVKSLGWESAVGKAYENGRVIGVVKDFHIQPFNLTIEPLEMRFVNKRVLAYSGNIILKVNGEDHRDLLAYLQKTLHSRLPTMPIEYRYLDDSYQQLYQSESRFGDLFTIFTCIALFIACIGLFGLVTQHVLRRTKEIGIRKVLGASVSNIIQLISQDFLKLVAVGILIAAPIAWWVMNLWLLDFAYRIKLQAGTFILIAVLAIAIAFFTIGTQAIRAAVANPIKSIRNE